MTVGPGGGMWGPMRSFRRDPSVTKRKLPAGTLRRIAAFARPYRRAIVVLISLLALDAALSAANPLIFRAIINEGILGHRSGLVVALALIVAGIAFFDAGLSLVERLFSSRIGEGLIFDMRTKVFSHIQRMPIAYFTRTQTGALISRLDSDVLGAQSAFTGTLSSVVTNVFTISITLVVMLTLSWQITLAALVILPLFIVLARRVGRRLQAITRESYNLNAAMTSIMSERFNVAGALLTKLFGRPAEEDAGFAERAGRVRDIGVISSMYSGVFFAAIMLVAALATALVYGWGGWLAARGSLDVGTVVALVGTSGAGKTTISQLVTRMYDVTGGAVRVGGYDVRDVTQESLRAAIGVVTQDAHMFHDTMRANLLYAKPDATGDELVEAVKA